jgi:hypothetical protein
MEVKVLNFSAIENVLTWGETFGNENREEGDSSLINLLVTSKT